MPDWEDAPPSMIIKRATDLITAAVNSGKPAPVEAIHNLRKLQNRLEENETAGAKETISRIAELERAIDQTIAELDIVPWRGKTWNDPVNELCRDVILPRFKAISTAHQSKKEPTDAA